MYIHKIEIGNIELKNNVMLAPMAGITDKSFRSICFNHGIGLVFSEMISSRGIYYNDDKTLKLIENDITDIPFAIQIFGNDPYIMSESIKKIEKFANIIDINMGCPAPKIVNNGDGSALLKNPQLIKDIVHNCVNSTKLPITVKLRKGWSNDNVNAVEIAKIVEGEGAKLITIHGRTRDQFYTGKSDTQIISRVKESVKIPVIGNGDIIDIQSAKDMLDITKVDGIMIGRGSLGNPWIFDKILGMDKNANIPVSTNDILECIFKHYNSLIADKGEYVAVREMRKHICWYIKGLKNNTEIKDIINRLDSKEEVFDVLTEYLSNS